MARLLLALLCGSAALWAAEGGGAAAAKPRNGKCGAPMHIPYAVPEDSGNTSLRYTCVKDYKRKAGRSSLVVCKLNETTKKFEWKWNLVCIRDPSKPEFEHTTEDARRDTDSPTPTSQPAPPKTNANPAAVSRDAYRSETTWPPDPSTSTTLLSTAKPSPEEPTTVDTPHEIGRGVSGSGGENVTPGKETTRDSWPESSKPSTEISSTTAVSSRNAPENTTGVSKADIPQGPTGAALLQTVGLPTAAALILLICGLWYCCPRHSFTQIPERRPQRRQHDNITFGRTLKRQDTLAERALFQGRDLASSGKTFKWRRDRRKEAGCSQRAGTPRTRGLPKKRCQCGRQIAPPPRDE